MREATEGPEEKEALEKLEKTREKKYEEG